jgi:hypothetical protein
MSRALVMAGLVVLWAALVAADGAPPVRTIDLSVPGALEALQQSRPAHFDKVGRILKALPEQPTRGVALDVSSTRGP